METEANKGIFKTECFHTILRIYFHLPWLIFVSDVIQSKLAFPQKEELPKHTNQTTKACDNQTDETENSIKAIVEVPNQSFHLPEETKNDRAQVFKELDQLMQKLYYSEAVPHQVALDYLKRVNKHVDELMRTSGKNVVLKLSIYF